MCELMSGLAASQTWQTAIRGSATTGNNLASFFTATSFGKTTLDPGDFIGPLDLGSPACCTTSAGCTSDNFSQQPIWDYASGTAGLNLASYGGTVVAWPAMNVDWAGLAVVSCYGDYHCWA